MGHNGNGHNGSSNGLLTAKSVQELLAEFEESGRQEPFEEIVRRYAGMVFNVCYGVTKDTHEAEDATQAVFLTLAVRSKTAQKIQYLGPWLQRVAQRLSLDIKRSKKRRSAREIKHHDLNVGRWTDNSMPADLGMDELRGILRDEIDKLPTKYRMPLILHYFGGLKPEELSKELGIKANTLGVRLHRARKMLGDNLQKRGIVVGGAMLAAALATLVPMYIQQTIASKAAMHAAHWAAGHGLVSADVSANVLGMMRGVNRSLILSKIKAVTAAAALAAAAAAGGAQLIHQLKPFGWELRSPFDLKSLFSPLLERLRSPVRLSDATRDNPPVIAPKPTATAAIAPGIPNAPPGASIPAASYAQTTLASIGSAPAQVVDVERTWIAPPINPGPFLSDLNRPHRAVTAPLDLSRTFSVNMAPVPAVSAIAAPRTITAPTVDQQFAAARGSFAMNSGLLRTPTITLDSGAAVREFSISSGSVRANRIVVADAGQASFSMSGGNVATEQLTVAQAPGSLGTFNLSGGKLEAAHQDIGVAGKGQFTQSGGTNTAHAINLGVEATGEGKYSIDGGTVITNDLCVGVRGTGTYAANGGVTKVTSNSDEGGLVLAVRGTSRGEIQQRNGVIQSDRVVVGLNGAADWYMAGGETRASNFVAGLGDSSRAIVDAPFGRIVFDNTLGASGKKSPSSQVADLAADGSPGAVWGAIASHALENVLVVGNGGSARVQLGNKESAPTIVEGSDRSSTPVVVRATASGDGVISGHGEIGLRGLLVMNGKTIADGFGQPRILDLSTLGGVYNSIDNPANGDYGYYAQRSGQVTLPPLHVASAGFYNWGESVGDDDIDLINSVRFGFSNVQRPGEAYVSLIAPELLPGEKPLDQTFIGAWRMSNFDLLAQSTDLLIRYDQNAVEKLGLPESNLSLWAFDGQWHHFTAGELRLNLEQHLIGATVSGDFTYFGVAITASEFADGGAQVVTPDSASRFSGDAQPTLAALVNPTTTNGSIPEPGTLAIAALASGLLLRRRR